MADDPRFGSYTREARTANLVKANKRREAVAQLRAELKAGDLSPYPLIAGDCDQWEEEVRRLRVGKLLMMIPGIGEVTKDELLGELMVPPSVTLMALTFERRAAIAHLVRCVLEPGTEVGGLPPT